MTGCSAYKFSNRSDQGFSMKCFPRDPARRAVWIAAVKRENWTPSQHSRLCEVHFDSDQFEKPDAEGKVKLKPNAIPTLFHHKQPVKKRQPPKDRPPLPKKRKMNSEEEDDEKNEVEEDVDTPPDGSEQVKALKRKIRNILAENRRLRAQLAASKKKFMTFLRKDQVTALMRKNTRGMKWSNETVKDALQLKFSCGTSGYQCILDKNILYPSARTLRRKLSNITFKSGILEDVLKLLEVKVSLMNDKEKHCILVLDEMSIKSSIEYDTENKEFIGNVTLENHSGIASKSLVFMLAGISSRWKQTVAYHFTGAFSQGSTLKQVILKIIHDVESLGLKVDCVGSDMDKSNTSMWKAFGIICGQYSRVINFITHPMDENRKLYFLPDAAHLLKNLRNMFVTHKIIKVPSQIVETYNLTFDTIDIEHVKSVLKFQEEMDLKMIHKLKDTDLELSHYDKMKVSVAKRLFNFSVSAAMKYLAEKELCPKTHKTTAWFIELIDRWYTLISSRHPVVALSETNKRVYLEAVQFIEEFDNIISSLKFGKGDWKPVQTGVKLSCRSILDLQNYFLKEENFSFLLTGRFTQDCLENLFSAIRARQPTPTPLQFQRNLKIVCVAQYMKNVSNSNYECDDSTFFAEFLDVKKSDNHPIIHLPTAWNSKNVTELNPVEKDCLKYISGYILSRVKNNDSSCIICLNSVTSKEESSNKDLLYFKNYCPNKLLVVNDECYNFFLKCEMIFRQLEDTLYNEQNVTRYVCHILNEKVEFELPNCHKLKEKLIKRFVSFRLQIFAQKKIKIVKQLQGYGSKSMLKVYKIRL